jgi:hypothetical protein
VRVFLAKVLLDRAIAEFQVARSHPPDWLAG